MECYTEWIALRAYMDIYDWETNILRKWPFKYMYYKIPYIYRPKNGE